MAATEPIRSKKELKQLADYFLKRGQLRNYVLIILGACTALRISDLLSLTWNDVYDAKKKSFRSHVSLVERKTGKAKVIALNKQALQALKIYFPYKQSVHIFTNNRRKEKPISRVQAWRIIRMAVEAVGIAGKIACHSLRKSWGYHAWTSGKVSPVVIMDILNHSNYEITRRYLGIVQDDLDRAYREVILF